MESLMRNVATAKLSFVANLPKYQKRMKFSVRNAENDEILIFR